MRTMAADLLSSMNCQVLSKPDRICKIKDASPNLIRSSVFILNSC